MLADELGVDRAVALDRFRAWQHALRDIPGPLADRRLASVIVHDEPTRLRDDNRRSLHPLRSS